MKPHVRRRLVTTAAPEQAYDYLLDFTHAEEWDPGTQECTRRDGDGGVGTTYRNVSKFLGRTTTLEYTTIEAVPHQLVHLEGRNDSFEGHDHLSLKPLGSGTEITYEAVFHLRGPSVVASPLVAAYLPILARQTIDQLKCCLDALD